jgi:hypothetical protein
MGWWVLMARVWLFAAVAITAGAKQPKQLRSDEHWVPQQIKTVHAAAPAGATFRLQPVSGLFFATVNELWRKAAAPTQWFAPNL